MKPASLTREERALAEADCRAAIARFAACQDGFDDEGVLALVTEAALWHGSPDACGKAAIRARLAARPREVLTLHVISGTVVDIEDAALARARSVVIVYRFAGAGAGPASPTLPHTIGTYDDHLRCEGGRWLIHDRRLIPLAQA